MYTAKGGDAKLEVDFAMDTARLVGAQYGVCQVHGMGAVDAWEPIANAVQTTKGEYDICILATPQDGRPETCIAEQQSIQLAARKADGRGTEHAGWCNGAMHVDGAGCPQATSPRQGLRVFIESCTTAAPWHIRWRT